MIELDKIYCEPCHYEKEKQALKNLLKNIFQKTHNVSKYFVILQRKQFDMKEKIQTIEKAVLQWYNIAKEELYSQREIYPIGAARAMFTYLLYKNGVEVEDIQQMMKYDATRTVYYKINFVQSEISHNHGRYSIDMQEIGKIIEENSNN